MVVIYPHPNQSNQCTLTFLVMHSVGDANIFFGVILILDVILISFSISKMKETFS